MDTTKLTRQELRNHLEARDLPTTGNKRQLAARLQSSVQEEQARGDASRIKNIRLSVYNVTFQTLAYTANYKVISVSWIDSVIEVLFTRMANGRTKEAAGQKLKTSIAGRKGGMPSMSRRTPMRKICAFQAPRTVFEWCRVVLLYNHHRDHPKPVNCPSD